MTTLEILETMKISRKVPYKQLVSFANECVILKYDKGDVIYSAKIDFDYIGVVVSGKVVEPTTVLAVKYKKLMKMEKQIPYFTSQLYRLIIKLNAQIMRRLAMLLLDVAYKKIK